MNLTDIAKNTFRVDFDQARREDRKPIDRSSFYSNLLWPPSESNYSHTPTHIRLYVDHLCYSFIERIEFPVSGQDLVRRFCKKHFKGRIVRYAKLLPFDHHYWSVDIYLAPVLIAINPSSEVIQMTLEFSSLPQHPLPRPAVARGLGSSMAQLNALFHHVTHDSDFWRITI